MQGRKAPFFAEVKFKTDWAPCYKLGGVPVHGIGRRNWEHYLRVGLVTKIPVWLLILEEASGELLALRMATAQPDDRDDSDKMERGGMVFWKKSRFVLVAQLERRQGALEGL